MVFWNSKKLKGIQKRLMNQQSVIDSFIDNLSDKSRNRIEWCTVHGRECKSTGLLMWEKDIDHKYTFLNTRHCNDFYHISLADVRQMIGKTDSELIKEFNKRTGLRHTFGEACMLTDQYVLTHRKSCRFWELGYIGGKIFILDVTKSPLKDHTNKIIGTRSWALNQSGKECEIKTLLEIYLQNGQAELIGSNDKKIAAYLIHKQENTFNGIFPK